MKIIIQGNTGTGKTIFYLPYLIKLLSKQKNYKIPTELDKKNKHFKYIKSTHWKNIDWENIPGKEIAKDDVLFFVDNASYLKDPNKQKIINEAPNVILIGEPGFIIEEEWIQNINNYLVIHAEYMKPFSFPKKLFYCPIKTKKKALKKLIKEHIERE